MVCESQAKAYKIWQEILINSLFCYPQSKVLPLLLFIFATLFVMKRPELERRERLLDRLTKQYAELSRQVHEGNRTPSTVNSLRRTGRIMNNLGFGHMISEIAEGVTNKK